MDKNQSRVHRILGIHYSFSTFIVIKYSCFENMIIILIYRCILDDSEVIIGVAQLGDALHENMWSALSMILRC